jgi:hypothetical protein
LHTLDINKLHTTELGEKRIRRNLGIDADDIVAWCKQLVQTVKGDAVNRLGKNWYVVGNGFTLTINASSHTIITAHKIS